MKVSILLALIITAMILAILGVLSIYNSEIIGAEFYWHKYKWFYIPKYSKPINLYYLNYIKIIGVGFISSSAILLVVSAIYVYNPHILFTL